MKNAWLCLAFIPTLVFAQGGQPQSQGAHELQFSSDSESFYAAGRWAPSDSKDDSSFPSETEIDCCRGAAICIEATAELYSGHPHVSVSYFRILSWDRDSIAAKSDEKLCMNFTMTISFGAKEIVRTGSGKNLPDEKKRACALLGASGTYTDKFVLKYSKQWNDDPYGESKQ
jgi:hypothetical protein